MSKGPKSYQIGIACSLDYPGIAASYAALMAELLPGNVKVYDRRPRSNCLSVMMYHKDLVAITGLPCGRKSENGFVVPGWVFQSYDTARAFTKGAMETDGGVYARRRFKGEYWQAAFSNTNPRIMQAFRRASSLCGYDFLGTGKNVHLTKTGLVMLMVADLGLEEKVRWYHS